MNSCCFLCIDSNDHTLASGTLTFDNVTLQCFTFDISNDTIIEGDEFFTVEITDLGGATAGNPTTAIVTIQDNDGGFIHHKAFHILNVYCVFLQRESSILMVLLLLLERELQRWCVCH